MSASGEGTSAGNNTFGGWGSNYQSVGDLLKIPNASGQSSSRRQSRAGVYVVNPDTDDYYDEKGKRNSIDSEVSFNSWNRRCLS